MSTAGHCSPSPSVVNYGLEFREYLDDAWYSVRAVCEGNKLRVKFDNFGEDEDRVFDFDSEMGDNIEVGDVGVVKKERTLRSIDEVEELMERFRPISHQLQDNECFKVKIGIPVCVACKDDNELRFYDGVVSAVRHSDHSFSEGEEVCRCTFLVDGTHGRYAGRLLFRKVEDICIVQDKPVVDQAVSSFWRQARQKFNGASSPFAKSDVSTCSELYHQEASGPTTKRKMTFAQRIKQATKHAKRSVPSQDNSLSGRINQDTDAGAFRVCYIVLVENLEKDLSSSTIVDFINKQTGIAPEVYIFPCLSSESYARGVITLHSEKNLECLYGFLDNPDHMIISSKGRPWVVMEKMTKKEIFTVPRGTLILKSEINGLTDELKLVYSGSEEYNKAKELKGLFSYFVERKQQLNERLAAGEAKILQSS